MIHFWKLIHENYFGHISMCTTQRSSRPTVYSVHDSRSSPSRTTVGKVEIMIRFIRRLHWHLEFERSMVGGGSTEIGGDGWPKRSGAISGAKRRSISVVPYGNRNVAGRNWSMIIIRPHGVVSRLDGNE
jgi:hypothetical protein